MTSAGARASDSSARADRIVRPIQQFIATESAGGIVLLAAALLALGWANSPWSDAYHRLIEQHIIVDLGFYRLDESLHFWVNDGAMVIFFFVVGLEIKREAAIGELASLRRVMVPLFAALGGMLVPVLLFLLVVGFGADAKGWGIPMATDIAFAMGVLALLGPRIPTGLKVLLLAIAIVDDIGAILVIAIFYSGTIELMPIAVGLGMLAAAAVLREMRVWYIPTYVVLGIFAWMAIVKSGVHPTLVGVAFGLLTPWEGGYRLGEFVERAQPVLDRVTARHQARTEAAERTQGEAHGDVDQLRVLGSLSRRTISPLDLLERELHVVVAFVIVPVFAFANAGVPLGGGVVGDAAGSPVTWGIALGLVVGKPLGIMLGTWLVVRGGASLPRGVRWRSLLGVSMLGGIGFTVSLLIADLSYVDESLLTQAKIGIMVASFAAGIAGYAVLQYTERGH
ncbi:MAG: Na+/H+ antiporter NhaA [Dehalococcoidia bacterium]|nr:Na+/H+ antiporter NhaA [Dehalococcoidia bacterium]